MDGLLAHRSAVVLEFASFGSADQRDNPANSAIPSETPLSTYRSYTFRTSPVKKKALPFGRYFFTVQSDYPQT